MEDSVSKRNTDIYYLFKKGLTLQQLGTKYELTRERVRQVIVAILKKEILHKLVRKEIINDTGLSNYDFLRSEQGKDLIRLHIDEIFKVRKTIGEEKNKQKILEIINKTKTQGIIPEKFSSIPKYAETIGVNVSSLQKFYPDIVKRIKENTVKGYGGRRWSKYYLKCRVCGTDTIHHAAYGYCRKCWYKSQIFKDIQKSSRLRHLDARMKHDKEYLKTYLRRPEVKLKMKQKQREAIDKKIFGGNREQSIEFHGSKCYKCGLSRKENINNTRQDLRVIHKNGIKNDHSLENLIPLCGKCFMVYFWGKRLSTRKSK